MWNPAPSRNNERVDTLRGQLLVASPSLLDPNFRRTVVLVTEHTDEGTAGLVLNRPSEVAVEDVVPQLEAELGREDWILEEARPDDVFGEEPGGLWAAVLQRKGGVYSLVARMPEDPSVN